jgi:acyl-CoA thioesterase
MAPPRHGNGYLPFVDLIALEKVDETTYRSTSLPFSPSGSGRAYGGHVYAQAVWAAAKTVEAGFVIHVSIPAQYQGHSSTRRSNSNSI